MVEINKSQEPVPDQILNDMLANLATLDFFDESTLLALRQLVDQGELNKPNKIEQAIKKVAKQP